MDKFNISFSGEILPDHDLDKVKVRFARAFHLEELGRTDAFFSGQKIILRRNLTKDDAARVFVALRKLGLEIHIEKIEPDPEQVQAAETPAEISAPAMPPGPRRRQAGAPNIFDLQLSKRAGHDVQPKKAPDSLVKAPLIAAALVALAFILVGLRFWAQAQPEPAQGLGYSAIDPRGQVVVQAGEELLFHDRASALLDQRALADWKMPAHTRFAFFANGDLLLRRHTAAVEKQDWLPGFRGDPVESLSLARCSLTPAQCTDLVSNIGDIAFALDARNDTLFLADAGSDTFTRINGAGMILASKRIELTPPLHLLLEEGILYLTQGGSGDVLVLVPDEQDFARELDRISLAVDQASQSGHIYPGDLAWLNEHWWVIMQSRDGTTSGLYQFDPRWNYIGALPLPAGSQPVQLTLWDDQILVTDQKNNNIYRFDATARPGRDFSSEAIETSLTARHSAFSLSRGLQGFILLILFVTAAGLLAFGVLQTLRGKVYTPPADQSERGFDINNADIYWLDPNPAAASRMRILGYCIAGFAGLVLLAAFIAQLSIWAMLAIIALFVGLGGLYFAQMRAAHCHLGTLDGRLILVDHTNTYRVGEDSKIQYYSNYVMIDDVIIYLGNRLVQQFANQPLQQTFAPLVNRGIKVDRTTLRVKLIQSRHPMWLGSGGLALALVLASLLLLIS